MGRQTIEERPPEIIEKPLVSLASFISASMKRAMAERRVDELTWKDGLTGAASRRSARSIMRDYDGTFREHQVLMLVDADRLTVVNQERSLQ